MYTMRMTLTAHAIVGAGIAAALPAHPVFGVCAAFASHFLVDAIPHYDYHIRSASINPELGGGMKFDRALLQDFLAIGSDFALGLLLALFFFATPSTLWLILSAAFAGQLPDALQFVYIRFPHGLLYLQRFHKWVHTKRHLRKHPALGTISQVFFILAFVAVAKHILP